VRAPPGLAPVAALLDAAVAGGTAPAAAALVLERKEIRHESYHGTDAARGADPRRGAPIAADHLFDVASLTKVMATGSLAAWLVQHGQLDLDAAAAALAPAAFRGEKAAITVRQLLSHAAGLPPIHPLARADLAAWVADAPLQAPPGARALYSDVGFVGLGLVLERVAGAPLDALCAGRVFGPLRLEHTMFLPDRIPVLTRRLRETHRFVPTVRANRPGDVRRGVPDDDVARAAHGVAGHAGVFSTARDVAALADAWLDALAGRSPWLGADVAARFVARDATPGSSRALAWDLPSGDEPSIGSRLGRGPKGAIGHLGFTGCSLWIDLDRELACVLLTNHCPAPGDVSRIRPLRRAFHDAVAEALGANQASHGNDR
jgi:CubicO group peptidase (beta-lactamase class C family)